MGRTHNGFADKTPGGGAVGRVETDAAGFMATRHGAD